MRHPGGVEEVDGPVIFGRRPSQRPGSEPAVRPVARLVAVPSPTGIVSGSHVEISRSGSTVVVTDLRSTNGTSVTLVDGSRLRLRQGDSVAVATSARVDIGDGVVLRIDPVADPASGSTASDPLTASREFRT